MYPSAPIIAAYSGQGPHRTGTDVDSASAHWLVREVRGRGAEAWLDPFRFERLDVETARLDVDGLAIPGVPLFDCIRTGPGGVTGPLSSIPEEGAILVGRAEPTLKSTGTRRLLRARHDDRLEGIVLVTDDREVPSGLALINAWDYQAPFGPPCLQVASDAFPVLQQLRDAGAEARLTIRTQRTATQAINVGGSVPGSDERLAPLVVMTPRSGWWSCASERGTGIAVWLDIVEALAMAGPRRSVLATANTGHELGYLGIDEYVAANPGLARDAHAWLHLGADVASVDAPVTIQYSDGDIGDRISALAATHGAEIAHRVAGDLRPVGEARNVFDSGGRYASVLGPGPWFHHENDRWPHAVDQDKATAWSRVFVDLALWLATE